ncbi:hypothetical protein LTS18_012410 [Coniosporium uncinatum]|uniref:Uncharacterized protein n=1 Tax=Coniosporium uncinatum TaxID=93489 RepID=A0ACC3DVN3_9PEZI|nr:hypothetical protein LTS18_012410 [Coniosporium uncinatum]
MQYIDPSEPHRTVSKQDIRRKGYSREYVVSSPALNAANPTSTSPSADINDTRDDSEEDAAVNLAQTISDTRRWTWLGRKGYWWIAFAMHWFKTASADLAVNGAKGREVAKWTNKNH